MAESTPQLLQGRERISELFDSRTYLNDFYSRVDNEPAMKMVLTCLPNIVERVSPLSGDGRLLDVGCGPTVHTAVAFRRKMRQIYLADYLPQNRIELNRWLVGDCRFNWTTVFEYLAMLEGSGGGIQTEQMESETRSKIAGILHCDIHNADVLDGRVSADFDVVTSFFCLEYAVVDAQEYANAVNNVAALVKPGGYLVLAGVLNSTWCSFGGNNYSCYTLVEDELFQALRRADVAVDGYVNHDDMYVLVGRKVV